MDQEMVFDFERDLEDEERQQPRPAALPAGEIGQQPRNYVRNFKKTVCAFWVKDMCMKGDSCGFLHEMIPERMPECQTFLKKGFCNEPDCPFKHSRENIKECNMYALGFCIFGPECRYNHTRKPGPPPDPRTVEAAKPKSFRDINRVVNTVNEGVIESAGKKVRLPQLPGPRPPSSAPPSGPVPPSGPPPVGAAHLSRRQPPQFFEAKGPGPWRPRPPHPPQGPPPPLGPGRGMPFGLGGLGQGSLSSGPSALPHPALFSDSTYVPRVFP